MKGIGNVLDTKNEETGLTYGQQLGNALMNSVGLPEPHPAPFTDDPAGTPWT